MIIKYSPAFLARLKITDVRVKKSFREQIKKFEANPNDPQLNNHPLKKEYQGYKSINITADWRALYKEKEGEETIAYFILLGTHAKLYR